MPGDDSTGTRCGRRIPVLLALAVMPWTVVTVGRSVSVFFPFGLVTLDPLALTTIYDFYVRYTAALPQYLNAYGIGVALFAIALASAGAGFLDLEDGRVTAALLSFSGVGQLWFAAGFLRRRGYVAVPLGTVLLWVVVWRYYRSELAATVLAPRRSD